MLHIVQTAQALSEVSDAYQEGDQVLLVEDSVYVSHAQHPMFTILKPMDVSVLKEDALARGISWDDDGAVVACWGANVT